MCDKRNFQWNSWQSVECYLLRVLWWLAWIQILDVKTTPERSSWYHRLNSWQIYSWVICQIVCVYISVHRIVLYYRDWSDCFVFVLRYLHIISHRSKFRMLSLNIVILVILKLRLYSLATFKRRHLWMVLCLANSWCFASWVWRDVKNSFLKLFFLYFASLFTTLYLSLSYFPFTIYFLLSVYLTFK